VDNEHDFVFVGPWESYDDLQHALDSAAHRFNVAFVTREEFRPKVDAIARVYQTSKDVWGMLPPFLAQYFGGTWFTATLDYTDEQSRPVGYTIHDVVPAHGGLEVGEAQRSFRGATHPDDGAIDACVEEVQRRAGDRWPPTVTTMFYAPGSALGDAVLDRWLYLMLTERIELWESIADGIQLQLSTTTVQLDRDQAAVLARAYEARTGHPPRVM
jgi:hypothetical protein